MNNKVQSIKSENENNIWTFIYFLLNSPSLLIKKITKHRIRQFYNRNQELKQILFGSNNINIQQSKINGKEN